MREANPKQMTKTDLKHWGLGVDAMKMMDYELMGFLHETRALPRDWDKIWEDQDKRDPKRKKVTISLDDDVVRFFKGLGPGYQPRMNRVLRAFMHFRLAKLIEGPDTMDYILRPDAVLEKARMQPKWGDTQVMLEE
ncbi:BrnA antitoxin family protein [Octadecabacter sp. CECT 8868]|uniref:BrnA antitoxin family protein n=1 Tax=Octadecabacter algicola TaxID=2909342 RepID=UPI001F26D0A8|nr:BrnA antitoxin family protein [Octadecabacter algicola]MCF2905700.1 BrnA antitoxin family protein [Octadecabacter algicola]